MGQLKLFEASWHLEQCPDDPPIDAFEPIYYTPWYILYPDLKTTVVHQLAEVIDLNANVVSLEVEDEVA